MRRSASYTAMATGGGGWFESWTEKGQIKIWLHPEPPLSREVHSFRQVKSDEDDRGPKKKIVWLPWVCHEPEEFHLLVRKKQNPEPTSCPMCLFIDHLRQREDVGPEDAVFEFKAGGKETHVITREEFLGEREGAWKDVCLPKGDYLINAISVDEPELGARILQAKYQLVKELQKVIIDDISELGDEGNPEKTPRAYKLTFDSESKRYGASTYDRAKVNDDVTKAWEGPAPDSDSFGEPGDPVLLRAIFEDALVLDNVPVDELFAVALEAHKERAGERGADFNTKKLEGKQERARASAPARTTTTRTRAEDKPAREEERPRRPATQATTRPINSRDDGRDIDPPDDPLGGKKPVAAPAKAASKPAAAAPARRTVKKAPEPEPAVELGPPCESCDFEEVPADAKECPNCGAEFEEEEDTGS